MPKQPTSYLLTQMARYIDRDYFEYLVNVYGGNRYIKYFTCWNQLMVLFWSQLTTRNSLRDIICSLRVHRNKLYRLGMVRNIIAELYLRRWDIEQFFKWIKQHLHIRNFYGRSVNAVCIQIYVAVITFCVICLIADRYKPPVTRYELLRLLGTALWGVKHELLRRIRLRAHRHV